MALVSGGGLGGWYLRDRQEEPVPPAVIRVDRPVQEFAEEERVATVPNVAGLLPDDARRVLADAGIAPGAITVADRPAAGPPGVVVTSDPPAGLPMVDTVTLGVSVATNVPDVVGQPLRDARVALGDLGARVSVTSTYVEGQAEGTVVSTEPTAGAPLGLDITVVVASPASSAFLADIDPVEGSCSVGEYGSNGTTYPSSLACQPSRLPSAGSTTPQQPRAVVYLVDRKVSRLQASVGHDDRGTPGFVLRVVVKVDDVVAADISVGYGETKPLDVSAPNALRITIETSTVSGPEDKSPPNLVLGSARVVGSPIAMDELVN